MAHVGSVRWCFDTGTLVVSALLVLTGVQLVVFWLAAHAFGVALGLLPRARSTERRLRWLTLERGVVAGLVAFAGGAVGVVVAFLRWRAKHYGDLDVGAHLRLLILSLTAVVLGVQLMFGSFLVGISRTKVIHDGPMFIEDLEFGGLTPAVVAGVDV